MKYFKKKAGARPASRNHNAIGKEAQEGMALIDWFAGQSLYGLIGQEYDPEAATHEAYRYAKAMMDERARLMEEEND